MLCSRSWAHFHRILDELNLLITHDDDEPIFQVQTVGRRCRTVVAPRDIEEAFGNGDVPSEVF